MHAAACAVGRLGIDGPWIGFAPSLDDGYTLVVETPTGSREAAASAEDLLSLAIAYFEDSLHEPPEEMAATHGDIGALVRHVAEVNADAVQAPLLAEAVDAIDDGLASDVVIGRLTRCLGGDEEPIARLGRRAIELSGGG